MKKLILSLFAISLMINGCSDIFNTKKSTWADRAKYIVVLQCSVFSKIGFDYHKYTNKDIELMQNAFKKGELDLKLYTKDDKKISNCCTNKIMERYTQDEYMEKTNTKLELQIALDQCQ